MNKTEYPIRFAMIGTFMIAALFDSLAAEKPEHPPANVFDMTEIKNPDTLDLGVLSDEVVPVAENYAKTVRRIELEFTSQTWGGELVRHLAYVYLPVGGIDASKRGIALINQGASSNLEEGFDVDRDYGALTAIELGIPSMLLKTNMPGDHWGVTGQGPIRRYTAAKFFETGDPNWIHWIALAKTYMRAMTVFGELEDVQATQFVLAGSSKRAQAIWVAAAVDDRISGFVSIARPGNFAHLIQEHSPAPGALPKPGSVWTNHEGSKHDYMVHFEDMYTTRGYEYMAYIDAYQFLSRVNVPMMYVIGTNDNLFHSFDDHGFYPFYKGDKSFAYVLNYAHGMGTSKHVDAVRAWVAHCFWERPVTTVSALGSMDAGILNVSAVVHSQSDIESVSVHYCYLQGPRFRDVKDRYQSTPMKRMGESSLWEATLPPSESAGQEVYWYVEVNDRVHGLESTVTTLLERTRLP
ncbi:MAG: hypothetical protein HOI15_00425 [Opitutales bacterium]|jgi:hypothetical protein|nr:hypothetical protein [Opitutales bacterium]